MWSSCRSLFEPLPATGRLGLAPPGRRRTGFLTGFHSEDQPATSATGMFLLAQAEFRLHRGGTTGNKIARVGWAAAAISNWSRRKYSPMRKLLWRSPSVGSSPPPTNLRRGRWSGRTGWAGGSQDRMAAAWLARGIVFYWRDELKGARAHLAKPCGPATGCRLGALGAVYKVLVDCATGDQAHLAESSAALESVHDQGLYGVSWEAFTPSPGRRSLRPRATWTAR